MEGSTESVREERKTLLHQTEEVKHPLRALVFAVEFSLCRLAPAAANELGPALIDLWPLKLLLLLSFFFKLLRKIAI